MDFNNKLTVNKEELKYKIKICVFCDGFLKKGSKLLNCLHGVCKDCFNRRWTDFGIACKCETITQSNITDYPVSVYKVCNHYSCLNNGSKFCRKCQIELCGSCCSMHINTTDDHTEDDVENPVEDVMLCTKCSDEPAEVYCKYCSEIYCFRCQILFHEDHGYISLHDDEDEIRSRLSIEISIIQY